MSPGEMVTISPGADYGGARQCQFSPILKL